MKMTLTYVGTHTEAMRYAHTMATNEGKRVKVSVGTRLPSWPQWNLWRLEIIQ